MCIGGILIVMAIGLIASRRENTTKDFFLAGRMMPFWAIAGSVFASNVSSNHVAGFVEIGYNEGFAQANFEFGAVVGILILAYFFMPLYRATGVYTLSDFLGRRFDERSRVLYWIVGLLMMVAIQMVVTLFLGAKTLAALIRGTDFETSLTEWGQSILPAVAPESIIYFIGIAVCAIITCTYTVFGGLKAVIWTDVIQAVLLLVASAVVAGFAIYHPAVGGFGNLMELENERFHVFFPHDHETLPWTGVWTGLMVLHLYYWGTNQFIVQRTLAARTEWDARTGLVMAGYLKMIIPFTTVVAGMAAIYVFRAELDGPRAEVLRTFCGPDGRLYESANAFTALAVTLLPAGYGLMGLVLVGLIGAILSTLDSMMNSSSTLFTFDIYQRYLRKDASDRELVFVGRLAIVGVIVIGAGLAAMFESEGNFFLEAADLQSYIVGGVMIAFMVGIFWSGATGTGSVCCIVGYFVFAVIIELVFNGVASMPFLKHLVADADPSTTSFLANGLIDHKLNFMHRTALAAVCAIFVIIVVSWATTSQRDAEKEKLVWWHYRHTEAMTAERIWRPIWKDDRLWAILLVLLVIAMCIFFR